MIGFRFGKRHGATVRRQTPATPRPAFPWKTGLRWAALALVLGGIGVGGYWGAQQLLDPRQFPLRHVRLQGELVNLVEADIQRVVNNYLGQNFFALDIDALHAALTADPWIEKATVRRRWPDTLEVRFRERTAFGHWGKDEMVDANGQRFRPSVIRQPGPWPRLAGPDGHELAVMRAYAESYELLSKLNLHVTDLAQDERRAWRMTLANGLEIRLGKEQFSQRLHRFVDIYPRILADQVGKIGVVDLRYVNGFVLRWKDNPPVRLGHHREGRFGLERVDAVIAPAVSSDGLAGDGKKADAASGVDKESAG